MSTFQIYASKHKKSNPNVVNYGTSGLRARAEILDSIAFRMGIIAVLRSRSVNGKATGLVITASHNPACDNGIKIIDYTGSMIDEKWENICTQVANQTDDELESMIKRLSQELIPEKSRVVKGLVFVGRDTRTSSPSLSEAVIDGIKALDSVYQDFGQLTTPQLHYITYAYHTGEGEATEDGYYSKFGQAFQDLCSVLDKQNLKRYQEKIHLDCANGVGGPKMKLFLQRLAPFLTVELYNSGDGIVNLDCGSSYVETTYKAPLNCEINSGDKWASFDGDADRLIYFYRRKNDVQMTILNGDKIASLYSLYLRELLDSSGLASQLTFNVIRTVYSNGKSNKFIKETAKVGIEFAATGVKNLMQKASKYDIAVMFESNGHGTILYSERAKTIVEQAAQKGDNAAMALLKVFNVMSQATGDAISDLLLVEVILMLKDWNISDWDAIYEPSPSRLLQIKVPNRYFVKTNEIATEILEPVGLRNEIDELIKNNAEARVVVRASGTEDIVRVYAEHETREKTDELAAKIVGLVEKYSKM